MMYTGHPVEQFYVNLALLIDTLKIQDPLLVNSCEQQLTSLLGSNYTENIFTAAILELSETDPESFDWIVKSCPELQAVQKLLTSAIHYASHKLIQKGLILGQDFSISCHKQILVNQKANAVLMAGVSQADRLLLEKIIASNKQFSSLTL